MLGISDQTEYVTGSTQATILAGKWTNYSYTMSTNYMEQKYLNMFNKSTRYWLASRCIACWSGSVFFRMFTISGTTLEAQDLYYSTGNMNYENYAVRPVVEIDRTAVIVGEIGDGSRNSQYSIRAR